MRAGYRFAAEEGMSDTTPKSLVIKGRQYNLPLFCPDATRGVVKGLDSDDLDATGVRGLIVNTWHLHDFPGRDGMVDHGGVKRLMNYDGLVISDSGGFQVHSLFQKIPGFGKITDKGLVTYTGPKKQTKLLFRPEDSVAMQFALGSDIVICLDDYTPPEASPARVSESVRRTVSWARRCKQEFERQLHYWRLDEAERPLLFAVIQGHDNWEARAWCAQELVAIGFDGYCLGGAKFLPGGGLDLEWAAANARLTPDELPRYAMGFGKPDEIIALTKAGYQIFDCVLPTRDARHGRLYVSSSKPGQIYELFDLGKTKYAHDERPLDPGCGCHTCQRYSRAYLHHLYKIKDTSCARLAAIHNVYFYAHMWEIARARGLFP